MSDDDNDSNSFVIDRTAADDEPMKEVETEKKVVVSKKRQLTTPTTLPPPAKKQLTTVEQSDFDALKSAYEFAPPPTRSPSNQNTQEQQQQEQTWKDRMAQTYHNNLYHNFVIGDLSRARVPPKGQVGFRWRTKKEVESGKGVNTCGSKHCGTSPSPSKCELTEFEVPFKYKEKGEQKMELVKIRLCSDCGDELNYFHS